MGEPVDEDRAGRPAPSREEATYLMARAKFFARLREDARARDPVPGSTAADASVDDRAVEPEDTGSLLEGEQTGEA